MDLPTCPSCGQSVLDEDAQECPFCGASMSGKPSAAKPKPKPPAEAAAPPSGGAAEAPSRSKPKPAESPADDDNPFEVERPRAGGAIQAARRPAKGRLLKVVCPMCDTPGFIPRKAAGMEVRCANKECLVPVFKSPAPKKKASEAEQEEEAPPPRSKLPMIVGGLVAIAAIGGGSWYFFLRPDPDRDSDLGKAAFSPIASDPDSTDEPGDNGNNGPDEQDGPASLVSLRDATFEKMTDVARESRNNRDKPFCRRMNAEALIAAGRIEQARTEMQLIVRNKKRAEYYRIFPLVQLAWQQLRDGDKAAAVATLDEAREASRTLPGIGRVSLDAVTCLAAAEVAVGKADAAAELIRGARRDRSDPVNRIEARLSAWVTTLQEFEALDRDAATIDPVNDSETPQWSAVAVVLCGHGYHKEALAWASRAGTDEAVSDALAAVVQQIVADGQDELIESAVTAAGEAGAVVQLRVRAAAARALALADRKDDGEAQLKQAEQLLGGIPEPSPVLLSGLRELYEYELPDPKPFRLAAVAAAEAARAVGAIRGREGARDALKKSIMYAHSVAPSPKRLALRSRDLDQSSSGVRSALANALNITSNDRARTALNQYSRKLQTFQAASAERQRLQQGILLNLARSALAQNAWTLVDPDIARGITQNEEFAGTTLPWRVCLILLETGNTELAREIIQQLLKKDRPPKLIATQIEALQAFGTLDPNAVGRELAPDGAAVPERLGPVIAFAMRYADSGDVKRVADFISGVRNPVWQETLFYLTSTRLTRAGFGRELIEWVDECDLDSTQKAAVYRGFVVAAPFAPGYSDANGSR